MQKSEIIGDDPGLTSSGGQFGDQDLAADAGLEGIHMGDDSHQTAAFRKAVQYSDGLGQTVLVQGAEALVHKHGIQPDTAGSGLDLVRKPQRQCQ